MQRFEVMNDYIDHTYRNTEREKQAEDTYFNAKDDIESKYPDFEKALQRDVDAGRLNDNTKLEMIINYNTYITQMGNIFSDLERAYQWRESSAETDRYFDEHGEELIQEAYEREEKEKIAEETMLFKPIEYIYSAEDFLSNFTERFSYSIDTGELREYYKKVVNLEKYVKETALNYCTPEIDKEYVSASIDLRNNEICLTYGPDTIQEGEYLARYQIDSNTLTLDWNRHPDTCSYLGNNQLFHIAAQRLANIKEDSIASIASNYTYELSHMINLDLFNGSARQIEEDIKNQTGTYEEAKESAYFMSMNQEAIREIQTGRVNEALLYREDLNGCPAMAEEGLNNLIRSCIYIN
jgi:hypothetical protein